ncbi:MAG: DUF418 domain-containing protein [Pseudohaliea sp.]
MTAIPTPPGDRILLLDTLRGFAVLGILLMNIIGFGLPSPAYSHPGFDVSAALSPDLVAWAAVELLGEGCMRGLFSLLFGAGLLLFTTGDGAKGAAVHYRRMGWLLVFGLVDAYLLLWFGDILVCYAICGALLYPLRNARTRTLLVLALLVALLSTVLYSVLHLMLQFARDAHEALAAGGDPATLPPEFESAAAGWREFSAPYLVGAEAVQEELSQRRGSYASAFAWNLPQVNSILFFVNPVFLLWDALMMMLLGMALYRLGILRGEASRQTLRRLMLGGFALGLAVNGWEVARAVGGGLALMDTFAQLQWSYHAGRLGMTLGYLGLVAWLLQRGWLNAPARRLAAVGRMALSNYLLHSLVALFLFTGAGLGLVGHLGRAQLYLVVLALWTLQLWLSPWWLARHRFGPLEYLWRRLTYLRVPAPQTAVAMPENRPVDRRDQ